MINFFTQEAPTLISTKFDENWALAFPASQCPVVPKSTGNVFCIPVTRTKTHFTLQKVVPGSHVPIYYVEYLFWERL